jgi:ribA/ribD-fused uncharacterized protein
MIDIIYFWGIEDKLSNFYPCKFFHNGELLNCSEQGYMLEKATFFLDFDMAIKIRQLTDPAQHKKAGKLVKGFDSSLWNKYKVEKMFNVCLSKFYDKPWFKPDNELTDYLLSTDDALLVEASPYDKEWGIGLSKYEAMKIDPSLWPGKNLLGKVLMRVRQTIKEQENLKEWFKIVN